MTRWVPPVPVPEGFVYCFTHKEVHPADDFRFTTGTYGTKRMCRARERERWAVKQQVEPAEVARKRLHNYYRLPLDRFHEILISQSFQCAVCSAPEPRVGVGADSYMWAVDHHHDCCPTGRTCGACTRGLLCSACNSFLGAFGGRPEVLRAAAEWLRQPRPALVPFTGKLDTGSATYGSDRKRRQRYRLSPAAFQALLEGQGGMCGVCSATHPKAKSWSVDHDHSCCPDTPTCGLCTRGLLCWPCNGGLGLAKDDPARLIAAAEYLQKYLASK